MDGVEAAAEKADIHSVLLPDFPCLIFTVMPR
jgi:hypothetical protein